MHSMVAGQLLANGWAGLAGLAGLVWAGWADLTVIFIFTKDRKTIGKKVTFGAE